jgi:hypothetical protein
MSGITMALARSRSPRVVVANRTVSASEGALPPFAVTPTATWQVTTAGQVQTNTGIGAVNVSGEFLPDGGSASLFEIRADVNSGSVGGSATGSWLDLSATRGWNVSRTGSAGTTTANITVQIRTAADQVLRGSASITLDATIIDIS